MADDPVRLLDEGSSELMLSLLSAAREEQPKHAAIQRTLTAVGVGAAVVTVASTASAVGAGSTLSAQAMAGATSLGSAKGVAGTTLLVVGKWLGAGALAGVIATSAVYAVTQRTLPSPRPASEAAPKSSLASAAKVHSTPASGVPARAPQPEVATVDAPAAPAASAVNAAPSVFVPALPSALGERAEVDPDAQLAAELANLDGVRQAIASGDAARALRSLNEYDARFSHPNLLPEALYLRLEALTLKGDQAGTEAIARRILRSFPAGPHAARARAVLGLDK